MNLLNTLRSPWAIKPDRLDQFRSILDAHLRGPKLNLKDMESKILAAAPQTMRNYDVRDGVAIIPITGPIAKNPDIFDRVVLGMVSSSMVKEDFFKALSDSRVKSVLFYVDSPGGTVDGTQELAQAIYENREVKPITIFSDGMIASAAYWIGSAGGEIYLSGPTVEAGSIGVYWAHVETSEMDKRYGVVITEITAGKYKSMGSPNKPLGEEARAYFQDQIDYIYSIFVEEVARNRGISMDSALSMADGKIFLGQQAIDAGLVDGFSTMDELISGLGSGGVRIHAGIPVKRGSQSIASGAGQENGDRENSKTEEGHMPPVLTMEMLAKEYPDLYSQVVEKGKSEARASIEQEIADASRAASSAETARIKSVKAQALPGHDALIEEMMFDGKTTGEQAAARIVQAEREKGAGKLDALKGDKKGVETPVTTSKERQEEGKESAAKEFEIAVATVMERDKCTKAAAIKKVVHENPELHARYLKEQQSGK